MSNISTQLNQTSQVESINPISSHPESNTQLHSAQTSSSQLLQELPFSYSNLYISDHFSPDTMWNFLDFFTQAPTIDYLIHRNPAVHPFSIRRKLYSAVAVNSARLLSYALPATQIMPKHTFFQERKFRRHLSTSEQQVRLQLLSTLQDDRPVNLARNTFVTRLARISYLFQNTLPNSEYTTYNHQLLLHSSMLNISTDPITTLHQLYYIGFSSLCTQLTTSPGFLCNYYPIVWDHYASTDLNDFQAYLDCLAPFNAGIANDSAPLLLVLFDADAMSLPLTQVAAPTTAPTSAPSWSFLSRILSFMNLEDRKQFCLNYPVLISPASDSSYWLATFVPEYNFANHVLEITASNWEPVPIECIQSEYNFSYVSAVLAFIQDCIVRRLCDFMSINVLQTYQLSTGTHRYLLYGHVSPVNLLEWHIVNIPAFELLSYIFDKPFLMQPYDITEFKPVIGATALEVLSFQKDNNRLKFMPAWSTISNDPKPFSAMSMPRFDSRFSQSMNYAVFYSGLYVATTNMRFFPSGCHISPPINTASQSHQLVNSNYYKVDVNNWTDGPSVASLIDLPNQVAADIGIYSDAGVSFLV